MGKRDKVLSGFKVFWIIPLVICLIISLSNMPANAADQENCQLCHRYSGLAAFTPETGQKKIFYVNESIYRNTVHGNVQCTHCHKDVKEVPRSMLIGMGIMAACIIFFSIFPGLVVDTIVAPATNALIDQAGYINGVMGAVP